MRGDWKLLQNSPMGPFELYNLADDPQEQHDLASSNREQFNELVWRSECTYSRAARCRGRSQILEPGHHKVILYMND